MFKSILLPAIMLITGACGISRKDESKKVSTVSGANAPLKPYLSQPASVGAHCEIGHETAVGKNIPLEEKMVAPGDLFNSTLLVNVPYSVSNIQPKPLSFVIA